MIDPISFSISILLIQINTLSSGAHFSSVLQMLSSQVSSLELDNFTGTNSKYASTTLVSAIAKAESNKGTTFKKKAEGNPGEG